MGKQHGVLSVCPEWLLFRMLSQKKGMDSLIIISFIEVLWKWRWPFCCSRRRSTAVGPQWLDMIFGSHASSIVGRSRLASCFPPPVEQQNSIQHMFCNMPAAGYGTVTDVGHPVNKPSVCYVCFHTGGVVMM